MRRTTLFRTDQLIKGIIIATQKVKAGQLKIADWSNRHINRSQPHSQKKLLLAFIAVPALYCLWLIIQVFI